MPEAKPYVIPKQLVWEAYKRVKANRGAAGVDGESLATFEKDLRATFIRSGIECRRARTFHHRCDSWRYRRLTAASAHAAFQLSLIALHRLW
jgi:retron-type reverse transcriptase